MGDALFRSVLAVGIAALMLTACAPESAVVGETPTPSQSPAPEPTVELVGFDLTCAELAPVVRALPGGAGLELRADEPHLSPGPLSVRQAGGLDCSWSVDGARVGISALPAASADFREDRAAAAAAIRALDLHYAKPNPASEVGEEATRSCDVHGGGSSSCVWSVLADDVWLTIDVYGPFGLVEPGRDENGYSLGPYLPADGQLESLVQHVVDVVVSAPRGTVPTPTLPDRDGCLARLSPEAVARVLGVSSAEVVTRPSWSGPETSARVSRAGQALPHYAADRLGWVRCVVGSTVDDGELSLMIAPGATLYFDAGALPKDVSYVLSEDGEGYSVARVVGADVRTLTLIRWSSSFAFDPSPMLGQFLN